MTNAADASTSPDDTGSGWRCDASSADAELHSPMAGGAFRNPLARNAERPVWGEVLVCTRREVDTGLELRDLDATRVTRAERLPFTTKYIRV